MKRLETKVERSFLSPVIGVSNDTQWLLANKQEVLNLELSVIIPYYKRPITLKQTIFSLLRSNYDLSKVEIIIVDDGSPSDLQPCVDEFSSQGLDIKYIWQKDIGFRLSAARNLGIRVARYENIIILDCDLAVSPNFLKSHAWVLATSTNVISVGLRDSRVYDSTIDIDCFKEQDPSTIGEFKSHDWRLKSWIEKEPNFLVKDNCWRLGSGGNIGFHKSLVERCGGFSEEFTFWGGEDLEWSYRAHKSGVYFFVNREAFAYHFESKAMEFQEDRKKSEAQKLNLLKELVPSFKDQHRTPGRVPYVSIFMTCYNKSKYIVEAITSILSATKFRHEVVIVDDGSIDNVEFVLQGVKKAPLQTIKFIQREHLGAEKTYKDCLDLCEGEYIVQLDADDLLLPNAIDSLIEAIQDSPIDIAYGKYTRFVEGEEAIKHLPKHTWVHPVCDRFNSILQGMYTHPLRVFKRRALARVGGFRQLGISGAVDFSLYSQLLLASYGVFVNLETYKYRQISTSISNSSFEVQTLATKKVIEANLKAFLGSKDFLVKELKPKTFNIFMDNFQNLMYLGHLGIRSLELQNNIQENPTHFIDDYYKILDRLHNKTYFDLQEAKTKKSFSVCLNYIETLEMYKEYEALRLTPNLQPAILKEFKVK